MNLPKTIEEANKHLRRLCEIDMVISAIEDEMNAQINAAKGAAERLAKPLKKERASIETAVKTWFRVERKTMGEQKSGKLLFGTVKATVRKAVKFLRGWTAESCAEALLATPGLQRFVRRKIELNKAAIHDASAADLAQLADFGLSLRASETITIEPDLEALEKERVS